MFQQACSNIVNKVYGVRCDTTIGNQINCSTGTGFMIAPGVIATAAHVIHSGNNPSNPLHTSFRVIRAPDIGQPLENAHLIAEDTALDISLLRLENPRSIQTVILKNSILPIGTSCGSLGFPLATVDQGGFHLILRFQGANISAFSNLSHLSGRILPRYETDSVMYNGSSGCPGFVSDAYVFGMHVAVILDSALLPQQEQPNQNNRLAISLWVPSTEIAAFARANGISI